jgi:hypothetical protein
MRRLPTQERTPVIRFKQVPFASSVHDAVDANRSDSWSRMGGSSCYSLNKLKKYQSQKIYPTFSANQFTLHRSTHGIDSIIARPRLRGT